MGDFLFYAVLVGVLLRVLASAFLERRCSSESGRFFFCGFAGIGIIVFELYLLQAIYDGLMKPVSGIATAAAFPIAILIVLIIAAAMMGLDYVIFLALAEITRPTPSKAADKFGYYDMYKEVFRDWIPPKEDFENSSVYKRIKSLPHSVDEDYYYNPDMNEKLREDVYWDCRMNMAMRCAEKRVERQIDIDCGLTRREGEDNTACWSVDLNQEFFNPEDEPLKNPYEELKRLNLPLVLKKSST